MKSEEMLMLQALKLKKLNSKGFDGPDLVEQLILQNPDSAKEKLRNICAFISPICSARLIRSAACST